MLDLAIKGNSKDELPEEYQINVRQHPQFETYGAYLRSSEGQSEEKYHYDLRSGANCNDVLKRTIMDENNFLTKKKLNK